MDCWSQVQTMQGKTLRTLKRLRPFVIVDVLESQVSLKVSTDKIRAARRDEIEGAFRELVREGGLALTEIQARHSARNTAYVAAILAGLAWVTYQDNPIRLFYRSERVTAPESPPPDAAAIRPCQSLSPRSVTVLKLIARGHTYDQILALHPELTYPDIFEAARKALER
ncbi:MAG: hypothetical protein JXM73_22105 [Anaerolineae bacterium]|nr:hypothetical protein [Anaerolineae bacterium]